MATVKIRSANAASSSTLAPDLPRLSILKDGTSYSISVVRSENLSCDAKDVIYTLFNSNMSHLQQTSSFPYTEQSKREELFDVDARYILLLSSQGPDQDPKKVDKLDPVDNLKTTTDTNTNIKAKGKGKGKGKGKETINEIDFSPKDLLGFCGFRFDTEETLTTRDAEVAYCYEVQLAPSSRGQGLGKILLNTLEDIGTKRELDKVMLTCLKNNQSALSFYTKQGYTPDEIDPTRMAEEEDWTDDEDEDGNEEDEDTRDYVILSKSLKST
ncbi:uncharacterized protein IL334_004874 [Kwoniella shivajii]|uniref:N-alpha-acetyltransferase 40 n=1 Tax=Kwoniella shivajii TaxID=564305 RepID=A0ABZ1D1K9_9TREE|nr:hypothetical protein IL334_004874 [Kwoniella shivajii]